MELLASGWTYVSGPEEARGGSECRQRAPWRWALPGLLSLPRCSPTGLAHSGPALQGLPHKSSFNLAHRIRKKGENDRATAFNRELFLTNSFSGDGKTV